MPGNFNPNMQDRFVEGMIASLNVPDEHFEIRGVYLERSLRARRGLNEDLIVNAAITGAEENEASNKVETNVMIAVRTSKLKRYLEITGVECVSNVQSRRMLCPMGSVEITVVILSVASHALHSIL
jgi:hypothetical protein